MYIAYIQGDEEKPPRKPTRKERIEAMADHLVMKWTVRDRKKAPAEVAKLKLRSNLYESSLF